MSDLDPLDIDIDVEVVPQLHLNKLKDVVLETLRSIGKPLRLLELREALREQGHLVSDDKLRYILRKLIADDILVEFPDCTVGFPEWMKWYIPRRDVKKVKPLIPHKFFKLYGDYASKIRRMGLPVEEALKIARYSTSFWKRSPRREPRGGSI
jgi:hypothetical protein